MLKFVTQKSLFMSDLSCTGVVWILKWRNPVDSIHAEAILALEQGLSD